MKEIYDVDNYRTAEKIAVEINTIKEKTFQTVILSSIEIGKRLCEAKELIEHGEWSKWLKEKVNYSQDTANNLMRIYREYGNDQLDIFSNSETFRNLGYSQAVALFGIPKDEREEFVEHNKIDENTTVRELKEEIEKWKNRNKELEDQLAAQPSTDSDVKYQELEEELNNIKAEVEKKEAEKKEADRKLKDINKLLKETEEKAKKAEAEKTDILSQLDEEKRKAAEEAESKSKSELKRLLKEKEEAEKKAKELELKTKALASGDIQKLQAYFEIFQRTFTDMQTIIFKIEDQEQAEKLKAGIRKMLDNMIQNMQ